MYEAHGKVLNKINKFQCDNYDKPKELSLNYKMWLEALDYACTKPEEIYLDMNSFKLFGVIIYCINNDGIHLNLRQAIGISALERGISAKYESSTVHEIKLRDNRNSVRVAVPTYFTGAFDEL